MVIVCSAIIHTDLTTTAISNQYRAEMQNANLYSASVNHRKRSIRRDGQYLNVTSK